ncbi:MAG: dihydrodipicolinate reductase C-terminal domain-containing protein, partial [Acidobacteriota bacterium]
MKIALHGYGRMGKAVESIAIERGHEVVARLSSNSPPDLAGAGVVIDFSTATALPDLVDAACSEKVNLVIGTTGWSESLETVREQCLAASISVVWASNFSPGANVMFSLSRRAGELLSRLEGYDCGIEERHHAGKKDSPSGTSLKIAAAVEEGSASEWNPQIVSSRVGKEFGVHTLFFDSADDLIEISHRARGRNGFARGA